MISTILLCDAVHEERVPPRCRAYLVLPDVAEVSEVAAVEYGRSQGWHIETAGQLRAICPSCGRT